MNNKSSPPTRSSQSTPAVARRRARSARANETTRAQETSAEGITMAQRVRQYLPYIGLANLVLVLGLTVVCLAAILLIGGRLAALPASIAETWFVLHAVPVTIDGVTLGAIPLLPAIGVAALIARRVRVATRDRVSILDLYALFGLVILVPFTLSAIAWLMLADASVVFPVSPPAVHKALFVPVVIHVAGMVCGMSDKLWRALFRRIEAPIVLIDAAKTTMQVAVRLLGASLAVFFIFLALGYPRIQDLLGAFPNLDNGGGVGLALLSVLYLPNAAIHMLGVLFGAPFEIAQGGVSLFSAELVPLPPLPLFGAIPPVVSSWAPLLMIIPAAVMVHFVVGRRLSGIEILAGAACFAVIAAVGALLAGGDVGAYGWIGLNPWIFGLAALAWMGGITGLAWAVAVLKQPRVEVVGKTEEDPVEQENAELEEDQEAATGGTTFDSAEPKDPDKPDGAEQPLGGERETVAKERGGSTVVTFSAPNVEGPGTTRAD